MDSSLDRDTLVPPFSTSVPMPQLPTERFLPMDSMNALVAVADAATRDTIADFFAQRGRPAAICSSCEDAGQALRRQVFPFLVIDLQLTDGDPLELCRQARRSAAGASHIIVVPAEESPRHLRDAFQAGADDYIVPPLTVAALQLRLAVGERSLATRLKAGGLEERQKQEDRRYRTLIQNMNDGLFQVDEDGCIVQVNTKMSSLTGYTVEELTGCRADDLLLEKEFRERLPGRTLLGPGVGSEEYTLPLLTKEGDRAWVKLVGVPVTLADGGVGALGIVQDISAQRSAQQDLANREEYFRALLESSSDLITIVDRGGQVLYQSPSCRRLLGVPAELMVGRPLTDFVHGDDHGAFTRTLQLCLEDPSADAGTQIRFRSQDDDWRYLDCHYKSRLDNPVLGGVIITSRDITARRKVEAALKRERAFFQQLFRKSPAGIVILNNQDKVVDANQSFVDLFQYSVDELAGQALDELLVPGDLADEAQELSTQVAELRTVDRETERLRRDQNRVDVALLGFPIELAGRKIGAYGIYSDITERKTFERKLYHEAFHDTLTGLPNRALLIERLERCVRRAKRKRDYQLALFFIDLDRFKIINDSLGHAAGDELLIEMARRLEACLRPGDTVARLGGDEFNIILEDIQEVSDATRIAERVLDSLSRPFTVAEQEVVTSGSIGIAFSFSGYDSAEELMRDADIAMYRAKAGGKARYEIFDADMHKSALQRLTLENELRHALDQEELTLHFQPIVSLSRSRTFGFEALVRWNHPERGLLLPDEWLPICAETGLMPQVGRLVLRQACRRLKVWQGRFPETEGVAVSVNVGLQEISHPDFIQELEAIVDEEGIHPASLTLEITEDALVDSDAMVDVLWHLRRRGFRLSIDDFGTGHSSLASLHQFPIDHLKIDRELIRQIEPGGDHLEIVRAVGVLGESLGIHVVAVGVEMEEQLEQLRKIGISMAQGFVFAKPLEAEEAEAHLERELAEKAG